MFTGALPEPSFSANHYKISKISSRLHRLEGAGRWLAQTPEQQDTRIPMRGFAHIWFFGALVALCSWYGLSQTRELLIRSGEKVYTTTGMDSATNFTRDHLTQPFRRSVREAET